MNLRARLPQSRQIVAVYGVIVAVVYGYSMLNLFWHLPSWLYFLSTGEILTQLAYQLATNLMESLALLLLPIALGFILPQKWFNDSFVASGALLMSFFMGFLIYLASQFTHVESYPISTLKLLPPAALLMIILSLGLSRIRLLSRLIEIIADRAIVFLYVSIPFSLISLAVITVRNLI